MALIRHAIDALEKIAPRRFAFSFDKVGLQVGSPNADLTRAVVSLDRSLGAIAFAAKEGAQLLVAHHPLIFEPLASVLSTSHVGRSVLELAKKDIAFIAAHTNWDSAIGGINDALAAIFELQQVKAFGGAAQVRRLKLTVFVPPSFTERIIDAASDAGAGVIGDYSRCAFSGMGTGTFLGNENSTPSIGQAGRIEETDEARIEMVLPEESARAVERAVRRVHPYEEPALEFFQLAANEEQPAGRLGALPKEISLRDLVRTANETLKTKSEAWGDPARPIKKLAIVGGAADTEWRKARQSGADALITGEVKQHVGLEAAEEGFAIIASGHYATEQPGCAALRDRLAESMPEIEWLLFVPKPGFCGRPFFEGGSE